ncbi:hypothetical protein R3P38DRAFT_3176310 [Favolaschia claudopus]|uniref:Uncharacterized protein n=1 Tax=Favolaschia claudopus TaxID=2862362 RepID=A0AAW0D7L2_9AGAR
MALTASKESVLGITSASAPPTRRPRPHNRGTRPPSTPPSPAAVFGGDDKNGIEADLALPFDLASGAPPSPTTPASNAARAFRVTAARRVSSTHHYVKYKAGLEKRVSKKLETENAGAS